MTDKLDLCIELLEQTLDSHLPGRQADAIVKAVIIILKDYIQK